ncbi:chemotaxis protein CheA [Desulfonatronum sp. SC1]|uniref:chemotaxis protein CheA n=1 Tax=Desulfonatronum sp. SC1 TaxID=2109626 RepID=UPI000D31A8AD|nr:chemotaxis protein CheA [Desulfonatronum sp. SC1]PTN35599.1 chemotaxis protein CheA [Desulfonatronum sp. SC1]
MSALFQMFIDECRELLAELETALLELETDPGNIDGVHRIFRALHTIKGSAGIVGLDDVRELTNDLETLFDLVRSVKIPYTPELASVCFRYKDLLIDYLKNPEKGLPADKTPRILADLEQLLNASEQPPSLVADSAPEGCPTGGEAGPGAQAPIRLYHLHYHPADKPFDALDPLDFLSQMQQLGSCEIHASPEHIPTLDSLEPSRCATSWDVILRTDADEDAIRDEFLFLDDPGDVSLFREIDADETAKLRQAQNVQVSELLAAAGRSSTPPLGDEDAEFELPEPAETPSAPEPTSPTALSPQPTAPPVPPQAASKAEPRKAPPAGGVKAEEIASIRVSTTKLDDMVDLVGQLVIVQARLKQIESELHNPLLTSVSEEIERLSGDLRERTLSLRMLPIGSTFNRFRRLVRDLSSELDKEIELKTNGADTELDKTVIEKLSDPLVHILRNSIDHGVESAEIRQAQGKPAKGTITLSAMQSAGQVRIIIEDDGGGIDPNKIFAKAVERGLARTDARPSDRDVLQMIFTPGFSTAEKVTAVSGRGVGMDVVKRSLESLKGTVEIDSRPGQGTAISIGLPLTLAIIEGLLVTLGDEYYVIPLSDVLECVEIQRGDAEPERIAKAYDVRGELLPCLVLRNWYHMGSTGPEIEQVVVVQASNRRVGLVVDSIVGQLQTVIKGLGRVFNGMKGLSGATIMGNGALALILDVVSLVTELERHEDAGAGRNRRANPPH